MGDHSTSQSVCIIVEGSADTIPLGNIRRPQSQKYAATQESVHLTTPRQLAKTSICRLLQEVLSSRWTRLRQRSWPIQTPDIGPPHYCRRWPKSTKLPQQANWPVQLEEPQPHQDHHRGRGTRARRSALGRMYHQPGNDTEEAGSSSRNSQQTPDK